MQLNIYTISHPILKVLSNSIINENKNEYMYINHYRYIGFLLLYEILRKYINLQTVYIKSLYLTKTFDILQQNNNYTILTNTSKTYPMITDIQSIMPKINIIHINYDTEENIKISIDKISNQHIFILEPILKDTTIIKLIRHLDKIQHVSLKRLHILCIASYNTALKSLGETYPKLKIYTTKIVYNKNKKNK
uniref:Uracil phosphoribosyltransferase n=1 Tax=Ophidocladus simpliciusculus TaxID=1261574 RepID=A0A1Z1MJ61_9FLOR|nr:uracil phosphoribosyltransferase [Ophidocladus simpliciusculus]ARW66093.1 uracil phosphoribosyltransferase [Ophidocladus simpliciusculus]